jgi:tetratricopeptide (TPR) repeat protein
MISSILLSVVIVAEADSGEGAPTKPSELETYKAAQSKVGHDASAHVRLALWCEAHGLSAERLKHLAKALLTDPKNVAARGLLGLVSYDGRWQRPDDVSKTVQEDPRLKALVQEYLQLRAKTPDTADAQWKLALWCDQNGLKQQAAAHFHQVLRQNPRRELAWKHLGFKKVDGVWIKPELLAHQKLEHEAQKKASAHWKPLLGKWRDGLTSVSKSRRVSAEGELAGVTDPRAVPAVWTTFALGAPALQKTAVLVLGQIDSPAASQAIAILAVTSPSAEIRQIATQTLRARDPREFAPLLVGLLRDPIKYDVKDVNGPGAHGELVVKQKEFDVKRRYSPLSAPDIGFMPDDTLALDANGLPVIFRYLGQFQSGWREISGKGISNAPPMAGANPRPRYYGPSIGSTFHLPAAISRQADDLLPTSGPERFYATAISSRQIEIPIGQMILDAQISALVAQQQLAGDVEAIKAYNAPLEQNNRRIEQVLSAAVGNDAGTDRASWEKWLVDLLGYAYSAPKYPQDKPTIVEQVPIAYEPQATPPVFFDKQLGEVVTRAPKHSCFGAGTFVQTLDGMRPIESLRVGDQVLTQNPSTGELKYEPLVTVYHNPPNATLRIAVDRETVVATGNPPLLEGWQGVGHGSRSEAGRCAADPGRDLRGPLDCG